MKESFNIYRKSRMRAAEHDPLFANRARAAEVLYISAESLDDYENNRTIPSCDRVQRMVEVYGDPDLRMQHIRQFCPMMEEHTVDGPSELALAACGWGATFAPLGGVHEAAAKFLAIARDGQINHNEVDAVRDVRAQAVHISQLMQETITAIDKGLDALAKRHKEVRP